MRTPQDWRDMTYRVLVLLLFLLLESPVVQGFLVHMRSAVYGTRFPRPLLHRLSMSSRTLARVQEKLCGREDLPLMLELENDDDIALMRDLEALGIGSDVPPEPEIGQHVTGLVISVDESAALLAISGKMSGIIPVAEAGLLPVKHLPQMIKVGDTITGEMIGTLHGMPVISIRTTQLLQAWKNVTETKAAEVAFPVVVMEVNKGGAVCSAFGGLKAFLPGSHCVGTADQSLVGSSITVKILDAVPETGKLVVSQRLAQSAAAPTLARGSLVSATVTGLRPYGAFLELEGGHSGLLHISQVSSERVENLAALFAVGDKVRVVVLDHDRATGKVALGTKQLEGQPGDMLRDKQAVFQRAEETLKKYSERVAAERAEREAAVQAVVAGLTAPLEITHVDAAQDSSTVRATAAGQHGGGETGVGAGIEEEKVVKAKRGRKRKQEQEQHADGSAAASSGEAVGTTEDVAPSAPDASSVKARPSGRSKAASAPRLAPTGGAGAEDKAQSSAGEASAEGSTGRKPRGRPSANKEQAGEAVARARPRPVSTAEDKDGIGIGRGRAPRRVAGPGRQWKSAESAKTGDADADAAAAAEEVPSIDAILAAILAGTPGPSEAS